MDELPLAAYAPDRVILVDSLSKRVAPGLTLGFALAPAALAERFIGARHCNGCAAWSRKAMPISTDRPPARVSRP